MTNKLDSPWYHCYFTEKDEEQAQKERRAKDSIGWSNHFESKNRWTGKLGEDAFEEFLLSRGLPYQRTTKQKEKDLTDFIIGTFCIDVKTIFTTTYPKGHFGAQVADSQLDNNSVNVFLFSRYFINKRCAILLGWITKDQFINISTKRPKGERITSSFVVPVDMSETTITTLTPMYALTVETIKSCFPKIHLTPYQ